MPCMSASGNISPQSISRSLVVLLDGHAVAADLPETAEEDDRVTGVRRISATQRVGSAGRERHRASVAGWPAPRGPSSTKAGASPIGRRAWPTGKPRWRIIALVGSGLGASSPVSNAKLSSSRLLTSAGAGGVALLPQVEHLLVVVRRSSAWRRRPRRRRRRRAAAGSSRRRRCRPRSRRAPRRSAPRSRRGCRRRPSAPTMLGTSRSRRSIVAVAILRPVRTGMS